VVMEGKVALRQGGAGERLLVGGDRWDAPAFEPVAAAAPPASRAPAITPPIAAPSDDHVSPQRPADRRPTAHPPAARPSLRASASSHHAERVAAPSDVPPVRASPPAAAEVAVPAPPLDAPANLFARGMSAFRAGRYSDAEGLWRQFASEHPQDPRVEDIAFLRAVARTRLGDVEGAAALARSYLNRFPHGMRRKEAEALTRHAGQ